MARLRERTGAVQDDEQFFAVRKFCRKFFDQYADFDRWHSSPIILVEHHTDPQIQNAMNSFDQLIFADPPPPKGATFSLKCLRVGYTFHDYVNTDHQALTEILGTWYSGKHKEMLLKRVINFLNKDCCIPLKNICATYFGGDDTTPPDVEWKNILRNFLPNENVLSCTTEGSFCDADGVGPCGPCSTIYYNYPGYDPSIPINQNPAQMWNFVFVKFNRDADGVLRELPLEHVIGGMNFESVKCLCERALCNYSTDVFTPLLSIIHSCAGEGIQAYTSDADFSCTEIGVAYRVIADHLRMIAFSTADGAQLGKHGRDTFLSFIDSYAIFLGIDSLKIKDYSRLVTESIKAMANQFPELLPTDDKLKQVVRGEVHIYHKTLAEIAYRSRSQKEPAGSKTLTTWYKTRPINFFGLTTCIVHKPKETKCPLVALCNVLLLGGKFYLGPDTTEVSEGQLLYIVQDYLFRSKTMKLQNKLERTDQQKNVLDLLPRLSSKLPMDVLHDSVDGFGNTPETALFDYLGAPLYHGCLVDQGEMPSKGVSKLTPRGLTQLRIELKEKEPSLLFWNDSSVTTVKVKEDMYLLVDDTSFVNEHVGMFWELLKAVNQGGGFMHWNFSPIKLDPSFTILPLTKQERRNLKKKVKPVTDTGADNVKPVEKSQNSQTDMLEEDSLYPIRLINFLGRQFRIILQEEGGPCSIIAICNVLILRGEITLETNATKVHKEYLIELVLEYLKQRKWGLPYSEIPLEALDVLPTLASFIEVNMNFTRTDSFEESPLVSLFHHLRIDLYHGWLPDPTDVTMASAISHSYDTLFVEVLKPSFENAEQALTFLRGPQLTNYGLRCLRNDLEENVLCVLFKEHHCNTVIKIKGELYSLATAACLLGGSAVWDRLTEGGNEPVDSNFMPISGVAHSDMTPFDHPPCTSSKLAQSNWQDVPSKRVSRRRAESPAVNVVTINGVETERDVSLETFSLSGVNHFVERKVLCESGTQVVVADTIIIGRIIGSDLLDQVVQAHKTFRSWDGNFNESSIKVSGGFRTALSAMITTVPGEFTRGAMQNDYTTIEREVLSLFKVEGVGYPAFFTSLTSLLTKTDLLKLSSSSLQNFYRKVLGNLALKPPLARAEFWGGIHRIRKNAPVSIKSDLKNVLTPPLTNHDDWRETIRDGGHPLLVKTFKHTSTDATTSSNSKNAGKSSKQENDGKSSKQQEEDGNSSKLHTSTDAATSSNSMNAGKSSKQENDGKSSKQENDGKSSNQEEEDGNSSKPIYQKGKVYLDVNAHKLAVFGGFKNTIDSATQFPRQLNEHASDDPKVGPPINEPFENESELDLLYSHFIDPQLARANDLLLTSNKLTHQLDDRLREVFESLERREVFPPYAPRRWFSS